jgi:hypothetical protein
MLVTGSERGMRFNPRSRFSPTLSLNLIHTITLIPDLKDSFFQVFLFYAE